MTSKSYGALLAFALGVATSTAAAQTCNPHVISSAPNGRYADPGDGTVTDTQTGLMWKKCSEGLDWDATSGTCTGTAAIAFNWASALTRANNVNANLVGQQLGHSDWRLPNVKELDSLVERKCFNPAINATMLPRTATTYYWSSSPFSDNLTYAWSVHFGSGLVNNADATITHYIRLVRGGQ